MKTFAYTTLAAVLLATLPMQASAQEEPTRDHLACYKVSDPSRFEATLNLDVGFEAETVGVGDLTGCSANLKSLRLCVPVAKTVTLTDATILPVIGQDLVNGFLCYKMKCPKADALEVDVADQFGSRTITVGSAVMICTPVDY